MTNVNSQIEAKQNSDSAQQMGMKLQKRRSNDPVTMMLLIIAVVLLSCLLVKKRENIGKFLDC